MKTRFVASAASVILIATAGLLNLQAQTSWNTGTGDWNTSGNWNPTTVPTSSDFVVISNNGTAQLSGDGQGRDGSIGRFAGQSGTLQILSGGNLTMSRLLTVGESGNGTMTLAAGGRLTSNATFIGENATGNVTMSGGLWTETDEVRVGVSGRGVLNLNGGILTTATQSSIGSSAFGNGTVTVNGGTWDSDGSILVGFFGRGELNIQSGSVDATFISVGADDGSSAFGTINMSGGNLTTGSIQIGASGGRGEMIITGGNITTTGISSIGYTSFMSSFAEGVINMSGGEWNMGTGALIVGDNVGNNGTLNLSGNAVIRGQSLVISDSSDATGTVNLNGGVVEVLAVTSVGGNRTLNFDGGTLRLTGDTAFLFNGLSAGNIFLNNAGGTFDTQGFNVATVAPMAGNGSFTKVGNGTLTLAGSHSYSGPTVVEEGTLIFNGILTSSPVNVKSGATLGGIGNIQDSVTIESGGILAPGSSPGILNVVALNLQSGSTTRIEINGLNAGTDYDQIQVANTADLNGILDLDFGFTPSAGDTFTIIQASAYTLSGNATTGFSSIVTNLGAALGANATIDSNDYNIVIALLQQDYLPFAGTPNQRAVAANLDTFSLTGEDQPLIDALNMLLADELPGAFDQIAPEELAALSEVNFANTRNIFGLLQQRRQELQIGQQFSANGLTLWDTSREFQQSLLAGTGEWVPGTQVYAPKADDKRMGFYVSGQGTLGDVDSDDNGDQFDFSTGGAILGVDYRLAPQWVVGVYAGYQGSEVDTGSSSEITSDSTKFGATLNWWSEKGSWLSGTVGGGVHGYDTERQSLGGIASGDTEGTEVNAQLAIGHDFKAGSRKEWTFGPEASLGFTQVWIDGFTESGSLAPLAVEDQDTNSLRSEVALRVSYDWHFGSVLVRPYLRAGWQHEFMDDRQAITANLASGAGGLFTVHGSETVRDNMVGGAGTQVLFSETISAWLGYTAEASEDVEIHSVNASVGFRF